MNDFTSPTSDEFGSNYSTDVDESNVAVLDGEEESVAAVKSTGPCCEKCHAPLKSDVVTICRQCGWYPSLGTFVEVDPDWETAVDDTAPASPQAKPSHLQIWLSLLPRWAWIMIGSVAIVIAESVAVRFATTDGSWLRTKWSIGQLLIGIIAAVCCHLLNFLFQVSDNADTGMLDLFLKPLRLWSRTCSGLPKRLWLVNTPICGIVAAIMSAAVIGGLPYDRLWDWGFKQPPKQNLMGAVMDRVKELDSKNGADNLEDAVKDFAGTQNTDAKDGKKDEDKPKQNSDCIILGYQVDRDGKLSSLVLGTAYHNQLVLAGTVTPKLSDDEAQELLESLEAIKSDSPFITVNTISAFWVQPKYTCRVQSTEQRKDGRLKDPEWDQLLGTMEMHK